ncbi:MAG: hypothetical protein ACRCXZ_09590 [Patescibacteria group bacterium]
MKTPGEKRLQNQQNKDSSLRKGAQELRQYFDQLTNNMVANLGISKQDASLMARRLIRELQRNAGFLNFGSTKPYQEVIIDILTHSDVARKYVDLEVGSRQAIASPILDELYKEAWFPSSVIEYAEFLINTKIEFVSVDIEGMALMNQEGADESGSRLAGDLAIAKTASYLEQSLEGFGKVVIIGGDELGASAKADFIKKLIEKLKNFNQQGIKVQGNNGKEFDLRITIEVTNYENNTEKAIDLAARVLEMPLTKNDVDQIKSNHKERDELLAKSKNWSKFRFMLKRSTKFRELFLSKVKAESPLHLILSNISGIDLAEFFSQDGVCSPMFFDVKTNPTDEELAEAGVKSMVLKNLTLADSLISSPLIHRVVGAEVKMKTMNIEAYVKGDKTIEASMNALIDKTLNIPNQDKGYYTNIRGIMEKAFIKCLIGGPRPYLLLVNKNIFLKIAEETIGSKYTKELNLQRLSELYDQLVEHIDRSKETQDDRLENTAQKMVKDYTPEDKNAMVDKNDFEGNLNKHLVEVNYKEVENHLEMAVTYINAEELRESYRKEGSKKRLLIPNVSLKMTESADEQSMLNFVEFLFGEQKKGKLLPRLTNLQNLIKTQLLEKQKPVSSSNLKKLIIQLQEEQNHSMSFKNSYYYLFLLNRTPIYIQSLQTYIKKLIDQIKANQEQIIDPVLDNLRDPDDPHLKAIKNLESIAVTIQRYLEQCFVS